MIKLVENAYNIKLQDVHHWFLQRCDIAVVYNLETQENVKNYINNLRLCAYPRRGLKHYKDESIYLTRYNNNIENI